MDSDSLDRGNQLHLLITLALGPPTVLVGNGTTGMAAASGLPSLSQSKKLSFGTIPTYPNQPTNQPDRPTTVLTSFEKNFSRPWRGLQRSRHRRVQLCGRSSSEAPGGDGKNIKY